MLLLLLLLCVYSRMMRSHETRALCAVLFLVSYVRARVHRQLAVFWLRRGAATAFAQRGCIRSPTHRSLLVHMFVSRTAAVPGPAQLRFYLIKGRCHFSIRGADGPSRQILAKNLTTWSHRILISDFIPSDLHSRTA